MTTWDNVLIFVFTVCTMPQSMHRMFRDNMDLNYIFNCMNIIIYNNNYCMQYILSREYMCWFFPLQKTSSSTIELSNHLLQATTNSKSTLIWVIAYGVGFDYIQTLWVLQATSHSLCSTSAESFWQMSKKENKTIRKIGSL